VRCARCGNENPGTNRFCGMCGATLLQTSAAAPQGAAPPSPPLPQAPLKSVAPAERPVPPAPRFAVPVSEETPVISGPSFLGLNHPAPSSAPRRRGSLSIDPNTAPSSRSLDYLLEDEHEHKSGGAAKYVLILLALALAVGLGYLRFKNQGLAWLKANMSKPSAATQPSDAPESSSAAPPAGAGNSSPASGTGQTAAAPGSQATTDSSSGAPSPEPPASGVPASGVPASPGTANANPGPGTAAGSAPPETGDTAGSANAPARSAIPPASDKDSSAPDSDSAPAATEKPEAVDTRPKPFASVKPARAADSVSEAQKYIYGRGVRQDCDHGLRLLKPAADQANPKAMIEMGALYSAGLCTPRDLPTAYRWFAMALRKQPDNQSVQADLQKLWGEMTQPERQLAIKLSQ
jgi:hypothetical protein